MNRTITFDVTDELVRQTFRHHLGLWNFVKLALVYAVFGGLIVLIASAFDGEAERVAFFVVAAIGVLAALFYWYAVAQGKKRSLADLAKLPHCTQTYTFTDDHFLAEDPDSHSRLTWDMLEKIECFKDLWELRFLSSCCYLLPAVVIDPELASFLGSKARERGVTVVGEHFLLSAAAGQEAGSRHIAGRSASRLPWFLLLMFCVLVYAWYSRESDARPVEERFVVESDRPKIVPFRLRQGDYLDLSVAVTSGEPVDVRIGKEADFQNHAVVIKSAGLFEAEEVRNVQWKAKWQHPGAAIIVVTSTGRSEVLLKVKAARAP
jgi:hypothetical protein